MLKVTLIVVGGFKEKYLIDAAREYEKRLSAFCSCQTIELKEERVRDENSQPLVAEALRAEGEKILKSIPPRSYKIALCIEGEMMSSESLAATVATASDTHGSIALIIGSSHGLDESVKRACDKRMSMSRMTFPHQLARIMLLEQLYRAFSINAGKRYHK